MNSEIYYIIKIKIIRNIFFLKKVENNLIKFNRKMMIRKDVYVGILKNICMCNIF